QERGDVRSATVATQLHGDQRGETAPGDLSRLCVRDSFAGLAFFAEAERWQGGERVIRSFASAAFAGGDEAEVVGGRGAEGGDAGEDGHGRGARRRPGTEFGEEAAFDAVSVGERRPVFEVAGVDPAAARVDRPVHRGRAPRHRGGAFGGDRGRD